MRWLLFLAGMFFGTFVGMAARAEEPVASVSVGDTVEYNGTACRQEVEAVAILETHKKEGWQGGYTLFGSYAQAGECVAIEGLEAKVMRVIGVYESLDNPTGPPDTWTIVEMQTEFGLTFYAITTNTVQTASLEL